MLWSFLTNRFALCSVGVAGLITLSLLGTSACQREVSRSFRIEVTTNQGDAVHDAEVKIAGRKAGLTDAKGILEVAIPLTEGAEVAIEVNKVSDQYYFAPHMETVDPGKARGKHVALCA
jgi:hypothetical protein